MSNRHRGAMPSRRSSRGLAKPLQLAMIAMGGVLMIYAQAVAALGVGEPRYLSHLFEPLRVDIPVEANGTADADLKVRLSFVGASANVGHSAPAAEALNSEWLIDARGDRILRIWASKPVSEPMLNLRVDIGSDATAVSRELTLLFDPPAVQVPAAPLLAVVPAATDVATAAGEPSPVVISREPLPAAVEDAAEASAIVPIAISQTSVEYIPVQAEETPARQEASMAAAPVVATAEPAPKPETKAVLAAIAADARAMPAKVRPSSATAGQPVAASPVAPAVAVAATVIAPVGLSDAARAAQIASTHQPQALSAADRWLRIPVAEGDSLEQLAVRVRGGHELPLPMVAMLLRWLNPRSFESAIGRPLPGAVLRFPNPESLAAQIAVSGGVWTVDDLSSSTADSQLAVPPPAFQLLTALSAESMNRVIAPAASSASSAAAPKPAAADQDDAVAGALASAAVLAGAPTAASLKMPSSSAPGAGGLLRVSGGLTLSAMLATLLSTVLMLKMVSSTPLPRAQSLVPAKLLSRSEASTATAAPRVLPAEAYAFSLDIPAAGMLADDDPVELLRAHAAARVAAETARRTRT